LLTLFSFTSKGHHVYLWVYETPKIELPNNVFLKNANEIIPEVDIFTYNSNDPVLNHGKGSLAGFSDIFRYKLLYEKGGWWSDMDVTCLKPLDFSEPYFFKGDNYLPARGSLMKCPKSSPIMKQCYEESLLTVNASSLDWMEPVKILNNNIEKFRLSHYIQSDLLNLDNLTIVSKFLNESVLLDEKWIALHWMNECWRRKGISKKNAVKNSVYGNLLDLYKLEYFKIPPVKEPFVNKSWLRFKSYIKPYLSRDIQNIFYFLRRKGLMS
jgi:hypothetical protein